MQHSGITSSHLARQGVDSALPGRVGTEAGRISPTVLAGSFRVFEFAVITLLGTTIAAFYVDGDATHIARFASAAALTAIVCNVVFEMLGLYAVPGMHRQARALPRVIGGWTLSVTVLVGMIFFLKLGETFSRVWLAGWYASTAFALVTTRLAAGLQTRRWSRAGRLNRRAVVYGSGPACDALLAALLADPECDIRICGVFDDRGLQRAGTDAVNNSPLGGLGDLVAFARKSGVDMVLVALPISAEGRLIQILRQLWVLPADIRLVASASRLRFSPRAYTYAGDVALLALADKPIADWGLIAKSAFDKVLGMLALGALAPLMIATAIAVRLDSRGPVLFRQKRYGFNNELIEVFKFRSMYVDQTDHNAANLVTRDDPRVTRVGRFIRKTSLDELPQLFNVIKGNLSLVGPRPHAVSAKAAGKLYDEAVDSYFARHKVKPGITGWAQINGWRGETDTEEKLRARIEHDLYYIENWSVFLDAYILLKTPWTLLKSENAY
jgi:Undecaprenyl-phosphate glucose phosphotransferase